jgi:deoxycytidylate deaminase
MSDDWIETAHEVDYWMSQAENESRQARCPRASCGTVLVYRNRIVGRGHNGPHVGSCPDTQEHLDIDHCRASEHSEDAAIRDAGWKVPGADAYVYGHYGPCPSCRQNLRRAGVRAIYYRPGPHSGRFSYTWDKNLSQEAILV